MFVYEPALLMIGDWSNIIWASFTAAVGIIVFAAGLHGYFVTHSAHWQSATLVVAGLLLIDPHVMTSVVGAAMTAVVIVTQVTTRRTSKAEIAVE
jgi:TRAP-type uncharacterized transport system fused permease subunit